MLTRVESKHNYLCAHFFSMMNFLPFVINRRTGRLRSQTSKVRIWIFRTLYSLHILHTIYSAIRLGTSIAFPEKYFVLTQFPIHFACVCSSCTQIFWALECNILRPNTIIVVWNNLVATSSDAGPSKRRSLWQMSGQELLQVFMILFTQGTGAFILLILLSNPERMQLPYSSLPKAYQNAWTFIFFAFLEGIRLMFELNVAFFCLLIQLALFDKCNAELRNGTKTLLNIRTGGKGGSTTGIMTAYRKCRESQLLITLFNQANRYIIFYFKLLLITDVTTVTFFAIRFFNQNPLAGLLNYYLSASGFFVYTIVYDQAFCIGENVKDFKKEILLASKLATAKGLKYKGMYMSKAVTSISNVGVQVGGFYYMERMSTINFLDFVTSQVANLLVSFP